MGGAGSGGEEGNGLLTLARGGRATGGVWRHPRTTLGARPRGPGFEPRRPCRRCVGETPSPAGPLGLLACGPADGQAGRSTDCAPHARPGPARPGRADWGQHCGRHRPTAIGYRHRHIAYRLRQGAPPGPRGLTGSRRRPGPAAGWPPAGPAAIRCNSVRPGRHRDFSRARPDLGPARPAGKSKPVYGGPDGGPSPAGRRDPGGGGSESAGIRVRRDPSQAKSESAGIRVRRDPS